MKIILTPESWDDYCHWQDHDPAMLARLEEVIGECLRDPHRGRGKPETLRGPLNGWWSRRINGEHRLVYRVSGEGDMQALEIAQCRCR